MKPDVIIEALGLPGSAMVNQRIPKKMLAENGAATAADRKLLQDHIEEISWVAAIKPTNVGVAEFRDGQRTYLELAVICMTLRQANDKPAKITRITELVHRAIPYPVVLILDDGERLYVSLVHIRWAQNETEKTVLDGELLQAVFNRAKEADQATNANLEAFLSALELARQPRNDLFSLYQGWFDTLAAWQAVAVTTRFEASSTTQQAMDRRLALRRCLEVDAQIASLQSAARNEKQVARQVAANLEIKRLQGERENLKVKL